MKRFACYAALIIGGTASVWACKSRDGELTSASATSDSGAVNSQCRTTVKQPNDPAGLPYGPMCEQIIATYPAIEDDHNVEDKRVLCPMLRMVNRSKRLAANIADNLASGAFLSDALPVTIRNLIGAVAEFGCNAPDCGAVAVGVSAGQQKKDPKTIDPAKDIVDISRLHTAKGVAHDCGFTFAFNEVEVSDVTRNATLKILADRAAKKKGRISWDDLMETKRLMCKRDFDLATAAGLPTRNEKTADGKSLEPTKGDMVEVNLIYTYLGGVDNGYVLYSDVLRFFKAEMPLTKTRFLVGQALFDHLHAIGVAPDVSIVPRP